LLPLTLLALLRLSFVAAADDALGEPPR